MIIKNQRPANLEAHLKYKCPNEKCQYEHWLSLMETKTKNFKVVCECKTVFQPKRIKNIKVFYAKGAKNNIDPVCRKATDILISYGFSAEEAKLAVDKAYLKNHKMSITSLIKQAILENSNG